MSCTKLTSISITVHTFKISKIEDESSLRFSPIPVLPSVRVDMMRNKDPTTEKPPAEEFYKNIKPEAGFAGGFIAVLYRKVRC